MNERQRYRFMQVVVTILIAVFVLGPLYWILATSLQPRGREYLIPPEFWPSRPTLQAYKTVLGIPTTYETEPSEEVASAPSQAQADQISDMRGLSLLVPIRNSLIVSSVVTIFSLLIASLAAYAIARLRFRYKVQSLFFLQLGGMIPPVVVIAPTFVFLRAVGLLRTLAGMITPNVAYNIPMATWLLACYFAELPFELEDAAKVDGYKPFQIFWRVVLPLSAPGLFSAGAFAFLGSWGEFMLANIVTMGIPEVQTVPIAILSLSCEFRYQWTWISAGIILSVALVMFIALVFQRWVIKGLTAGAVKY